MYVHILLLYLKKTIVCRTLQSHFPVNLKVLVTWSCRRCGSPVGYEALWRIIATRWLYTGRSRLLFYVNWQRV